MRRCRCKEIKNDDPKLDESESILCAIKAQVLPKLVKADEDAFTELLQVDLFQTYFWQISLPGR